jgi:non-specific serine/threonine protein kinase
VDDPAGRLGGRPVTEPRRCPVCGTAITGRTGGRGSGRPATYCSGVCRQRAFRRRTSAPPAPGERSLPLCAELPAALDSFVGRQPELRRLRPLLRSSRLVSLVGPPGVGKSRLAAELARAERGRLPGVRVLRLAAPPSPGTAKELLNAVGDRRLLLLLDDCDQLARSCARLAERLLRSCPGVLVLATGRGPLHVTGETVVRVGTLPLPTGSDRSAVLHSWTGRLFVERAHASDPSFELTEDNAGLVADICVHLDGLPLAVELAALRIGALTPAQLLAALDDELAVLTDGSRTGPGRHRDLRTALDLSHRLLSQRQRAVFRRLSVLAGGFDVGGATAVCAAGDVSAPEVAAVLGTLVDVSVVVETSGEPGRYRQPGAVRAYAADRLAAARETDRTTALAIDWLAGLVEPMTRTIYVPEATLQRLRQERDNIAAAVRAAAAATDDRRVLLAVALARIWQEEDRGTAGRRLLTEVLDQAPHSYYRADAISAIAEIACRQGDLDEALRCAGVAARLERGRDRPIGLARALHVLAFTRLCRGEESRAIAAQQECLAIVSLLGRDADIALVRGNLAWQLLQAGQGDAAERLLADGGRTDPDPGALPRAHAAAMHTIGMLRLARGDLAAAEESFVEGLHRTRPESMDGTPLIEGLAIIAARRGDPARAVCLAAAASAVRARLGVVAGVEWRQQVQLAMSEARQRLGPSRAASATAAGERIRGAVLRSYALRHLVAAPEQLADRPRGERLLTDRECRIVALVAQGLTNREIADRLHLPIGTVRTVVTALLDKLYLRSRIQLAVWAATEGADVS